MYIDVCSYFLSLKIFSHRLDMGMVSLQYVFSHVFSNGSLNRNISGSTDTDEFYMSRFHPGIELEYLKIYLSIYC